MNANKKRAEPLVLKKGYIGIDEVGRGPLAGPITVCACYIEDTAWALKNIFQGTIRDSKKLSNPLRNKIFQTIRLKRLLKTRIEYVVSSRSAEYIDRHGISKATTSCLIECMAKLRRKGVDSELIPIRLDAGLKIPLNNLTQESFIKGDEKYVEIALASIMAKVTRDLYMMRLSHQYPEYGWLKNMGYGTEGHRKAIKEYGITKYHRKTFLKAFEPFEKAE